MNALTLTLSLTLAALLPGADVEIRPDRANEIRFDSQPAKFVRFVIHASSGAQPCIDELEVYGEGGKDNLALATRGAKATASSCLPGFPTHQIAHLNDGLYGNSHSWISAGTTGEWAQIELPESTKVAKVVFSRDRAGRFSDRVPIHFEIRFSADGKKWKTVRTVKTTAAARTVPRQRQQFAPSLPYPLSEPGGWPPRRYPVLEKPLEGDALLRYAFLCEAGSFWRIDRREPVSRVLEQLEAMIERFAAKGLDVAGERARLAGFRRRQESLTAAAEKDVADERAALFFDARSISAFVRRFGPTCW
jgi:hypothetical protein